MGSKHMLKFQVACKMSVLQVKLTVLKTDIVANAIYYQNICFAHVFIFKNTVSLSSFPTIPFVNIRSHITKHVFNYL